ncbi:Uncharacterised protein [Vibrio owensii]|jgi:hypothetical protein|uniref:DUF1127 domain-containing protein n=1 Tax=Vibrio owensii CAIM 1854 = LMG 25443 TaxID=1229493 RepID=A0A0C1Z3U6_9VIBR|nr:MULTISPECIES: hypothetical protein [Vibrio]EEZ89740.1 conserved hypothetical protein [Vibrio harveyi 1DA3]GAK23877.1 hypothetical protein JCM19052_4525 [Vibrio sp. JCM 19052]AQW57651.1 DUF1127 domain-containing protein [Vibrio owensii]AYO20948.1 DUF1127 domain-containing protein [Vibrio owensii]EKM21971.1 hypothetical protein VCHENC03_3109 [Vibrio sp. HENC-03]
MRHSIYLKLATVLLKADLKREEKQWQRMVRRSSHDIPWTNEHLLKDIGLDKDGRSTQASVPDAVKVERRVRHLRRVLTSRILT